MHFNLSVCKDHLSNNKDLCYCFPYMVFVIDHVMKIIHRGQSELLEHVCYSILINFITEYRPFSLHAIVKWKDNYSTRTRDTSD